MNTKQFFCVLSMLFAWQLDLEASELEYQQEIAQEQIAPDNITDLDAETK
jgi:hypothetical protein